MSESPSYGKPALLYAVASRGAQSYLELAREVVSRWNENGTREEESPRQGLSALLAPSPGARIRRNPPVLQCRWKRSARAPCSPGNRSRPRRWPNWWRRSGRKGAAAGPGAPHGGRVRAGGGERRFRAAESAGLSQIRVVRKLTDREALEVALVENVQRADLNAIELAEGYNRLLHDFSLPGAGRRARRKTGRRWPTRCGSFGFRPRSRQAVSTGPSPRATPGAVVRAAGARAFGVRDGAAPRAVRAETERLCAGEPKKRTARKTAQGNVHLRSLEEGPDPPGGTRVRLRGTFKKGRIEVFYFSTDELDRLQRSFSGKMRKELPRNAAFLPAYTKKILQRKLLVLYFASYQTPDIIAQTDKSRGKSRTNA